MSPFPTYQTFSKQEQCIRQAKSCQGLVRAGHYVDTYHQPRRVVQVDLVQHPKISQFTDIDSSDAGYGRNACALVAAAAALGGNDWTQLSLRWPNYAHFARVLGLDLDRHEIYLENTLAGAPYWTVSLKDFVAEWLRPETTVSDILAPREAEEVTRWMVSINNTTPL